MCSEAFLLGCEVMTLYNESNPLQTLKETQDSRISICLCVYVCVCLMRGLEVLGLLVNRPVNETNGFLSHLTKTTSTIQVCAGFGDDFSAWQQTDFTQLGGPNLSVYYCTFRVSCAISLSISFVWGLLNITLLPNLVSCSHWNTCSAAAEEITNDINCCCCNKVIFCVLFWTIFFRYYASHPLQSKNESCLKKERSCWCVAGGRSFMSSEVTVSAEPTLWKRHVFNVYVHCSVSW